MTNYSPTICLNMIVKNENKIIIRLLESVLPIIDTYCICDTGSNDNTIELMQQFFDKNKINGKFLFKEFIDFGTNRDYVLQESKELADYNLLLDADMILNIDEKFNKNDLIKDVYLIKQGSEDFEYYNVRLISNKINSKCIGVTHEYYNYDKCNEEKISSDLLFISDIGDGGCKENKFIRDIKLLEHGIENINYKEKYLLNRYIFYLANSYYDIKDYDNAIKTYKKYLHVGTWNEEIFYSYYRIGLCYKNQFKYDNMIKYLLLAYNEKLTRLEPIYELVNYYRIHKQYNLCKLFYDIGKNIPYPENDILFLNKDVWDYKLLYEYSIFSYYLNEKLSIKELHILLEKLPDKLLKNLLENYKFYYKKIDYIKKIDFSNQIFKDSEKFYSSTPSIIDIPENFSEHFYKKTKYLMNLRFVNYSINKQTQEYIWNNKQIATINRYIELNENFEIIKQFDFDFNKSDDLYEGIEDVKLLQINKYNKNIKYTATKPLSKNKINVCYGKYIMLLMDNNKLDYKIINYDLSENKHEKNWVFIPRINDSKQKMIYKWKPLTIGEINDKDNKLDNIEMYNMPKIFGYLRGSTNGYLYDKEIWFLCHLVINDELRYYYNIFVIFDENMKKYRYSIPFKLTNSNIEYSCGLIVNDNNVILSYSEMDNNSYVNIFDKEYIKSLCN
jgi:hypothetical protein